MMRLWPLDFSAFLIETDLNSPVASMDVSRDGLLVACATQARCISVLDFPTRNLFSLIQSHPSRIRAARFHPTRGVVATISEDAAIRIWGTADYECIGQYDCKQLAGADSQHASGVAPMETTANTTARSVVVPVGTSGLGMPASLHGLNDGTGMNTTRRSERRTELGLGGAEAAAGVADTHPLALHWSQEPGAALLAVGFSGGTVRVFDIDHRCVLGTYSPHETNVEAVLYTANGMWLASMDSFAICFADVRHGYHVSRVCRFTYPTPQVALAESQDGRYLATVGPNGNTLHLYEAERGVEVGTVEDRAAETGDGGASRGCWTDVAFGEGRYLYAASAEGSVVQWLLPEELPTPPEAEDLDFGIPAPAIPAARVGRAGAGRFGGKLFLSPDRRWAVGCCLDDETAGAFAIAALPTRRGASPPVLAFHDGTFTAAAWSSACDEAGRTTVLSADSNGAMAFWSFKGAATVGADAVRPLSPPLLPTPRAAQDDTRTQQHLDVSKAFPPSHLCDPETLHTDAAPHTPALLRLFGSGGEETTLPTPGSRSTQAGGHEALHYAPTRLFAYDRVSVRLDPDDENVPSDDQSGVTPVAAWGVNGSTVDGVAVTPQGGVLTACGGVVKVEDFAEMAGAAAAAQPLPKTLRLLMNEGFVSAMSVSQDGRYLAAALFTGGESSRLVIWCLKAYECLANAEVKTACVHGVAWSPKPLKQALASKVTSTASLCLLGYTEVISARFTEGDITSHVLQFDTAGGAARYSQAVGLQVHGGFCLVGAAGMAVVTLGTLHDRAAQRFAAPHGGGLQCCEESARNCGLVCAGGCDGGISAWVTGATHDPVLKYRYAGHGGAPVASLRLADKGTRMYACTPHGHVHPAVTLLSVVEDADAGKLQLSVLLQVDMKLGVPRCVPQLCGGHALFALANGAVHALPCGDYDAAPAVVRDKPPFDDSPRYLAPGHGLLGVGSRGGACLYDTADGALLGYGPTRAGVNGIALHALGVVTVEDDGCLAVLGLDAGALRERHRFKLAATALTSVVFTTEDDLLVADSVGGVYALNVRQRHSATVVCDPDEDPHDGSGVLDVTAAAADSARGAGLVPHPRDASFSPHSANATMDLDVSVARSVPRVRASPPRDRPRGHACTLRTAAAAAEYALHASYHRNCLTVLRAMHDGEYDVVACFSPTEPFEDARISSDGQEVVYLQGAQLVVLNCSTSVVTRVIHLPRPCTRFVLSPDDVYAVCWGAAGSARFLLIDYEFATVQEIEGHAAAPTQCAFAGDGKHLYSVSGTQQDFELLKWQVRQLGVDEP
eukprot:TRINITY_DN10476_c0_g2_i1.p1 TRINITY_DN10476_c0_g2~~TRINITY_DN10476_c0_g2_i1.p1  ORF type:complete len:1296 (+),score=452.58 TRINITY_DN10476_c0_g2_i1:3-3890(+)